MTAPPNFPSILILPGFGNVASDYGSGLAGDGSDCLAGALSRRGFRVSVLPVSSRWEWARVILLSLLNPAYWFGIAGIDSYRWYLDKVEAALTAGGDGSGDDGGPVVLIGHSAGGWLARAYLALSVSGSLAAGRVAGLVTLGAPQAPPRDGARCATGGALASVVKAWGEADVAVPVIAVAGRSVRGVAHPRPPKDSSGEAEPEQRRLSRAARGSYLEVAVGAGSGRAGRNGVPPLAPPGVVLEGDGVVPLSHAVLPGPPERTTSIVVDGAMHSMSRVGSFEEPGGVPWVGGEGVVDHWLGELVVAVGG